MSPPLQSVQATREYLHKVCGFSSAHETMQSLDALIAENAKLRDQIAGLEAACDSLGQTIYSLQNP